MIPRYSNPEMTKIWDESNRYQIMLDVEIAACEAQEKLKVVPEGTAERIRQKAKFDPKKIEEIEREVKHDIIAFLTNVAESTGPDSKYMHYGMTSSDALDTCSSIQLKQACNIILRLLTELQEALLARANEHKYTPAIGRTHGIHAEPITMGVKLLRFYNEFKRARKRIVYAVEEISTCKISGAVGTYTQIDPFVEEHVANTFGLTPEDSSSQVIPRDRHAALVSAMALMASSIENIAVEIRHMQRTEVGEANEFFDKKQKGSSAMPHKKNPILTENLTGLARFIRSFAVPAMENVALWHERDISHSSVERFMFPDLFITADFALRRLIQVVTKLQINTKNLDKNINLTNGVIFSQKILLKLVDAGMSREDAYLVVQRNAIKAYENNLDFLELIKQDPDVSLSEEKLKIDLMEYYQHIELIFKRSIAS